MVHAVKGKRQEYQPIKSVLCKSPSPLDVAVAFKSFGFSQLYVADLNSIMGNGENMSLIEQIADVTGLRLIVDAGIRDLNLAQELLEQKVWKIIIGTETLPNLDLVKSAIQRFGSERIIASLDLKAGKILSDSEALKSMSPIKLAKTLEDMGVNQLILLDLARVGSGEGVDFSFLKELQSKVKVKVLVGGGVRNIEDLTKLKNMGIYGVLLATSLHSGAISIEELKNFE